MDLAWVEDKAFGFLSRDLVSQLGESCTSEQRAIAITKVEHEISANPESTKYIV